MNYQFKIHRKIALNIIYLLLPLIAHIALFPSNEVEEKSNVSDCSIVVSENNSVEIYADIEDALEIADAHFLPVNYSFTSEQNIVSPFIYARCGDTQVNLLLVFLFQTDLPPPHFFT